MHNYYYYNYYYYSIIQDAEVFTSDYEMFDTMQAIERLESDKKTSKDKRKKGRVSGREGGEGERGREELSMY